MRLRGFHDSRGRESITLFFVAITWGVMLIKFMLASLDLGPFGAMPAMGVAEFGGAVAAVLLIWLGREWTEKKGAPSGPTQ